MIVTVTFFDNTNEKLLVITLDLPLDKDYSRTASLFARVYNSVYEDADLVNREKEYSVSGLLKVDFYTDHLVEFLVDGSDSPRIANFNNCPIKEILANVRSNIRKVLVETHFETLDGIRESYAPDVADNILTLYKTQGMLVVSNTLMLCRTYPGVSTW